MADRADRRLPAGDLIADRDRAAGIGRRATEQLVRVARSERKARALAGLETDPFEPAQTPDTLLSRAAQWLKPVIPAPPAAPSLSMTGWIDEYSARKQPAPV